MEAGLGVLQMITTFLITIISLLIGYTLGRYSPDELKQKYVEYTKELKKKSSPVGAVLSPDAKRLEQLNNPKKYEGEKEMEKVFEELLK